jgi:hypothetical protein
VLGRFYHLLDDQRPADENDCRKTKPAVLVDASNSGGLGLVDAGVFPMVVANECHDCPGYGLGETDRRWGLRLWFVFHDWARHTLAGNWSSNVTFKQEHELVRTGPYRYVRHPIYTGLLIMSLGTAIEIGQLHCWLSIPISAIGFWIKLSQEERLLLRHFPNEYPAYQKQVKALVPFVL